MILLIEPQCIGWQHESVNAGFIENIKKIVGKEEIRVYAESEHIICLRKLLPYIEKEVLFFPIHIPDKNLDYATPFLSYYKLFKNIMRNLGKSNVRSVFFLSGNKGNLIAARKIALEFRNISFYIVMHGIMEQMVNKDKVPKHTFWPLKSILNSFSNIKNVEFITYSPKAKEILRGKYRGTFINKLCFIHLPFPTFMENCKKLNDDGKIHIAILGAGAKKETYEFIQSIDNEIKEKVSFDILLRDQSDFASLKSVNIVKKCENITYFEIAHLISKCNFTFIPYTSKEYQVSSSGILMDSIQQSTPVLSFDTNTVLWYNQYNIGKVCVSYDEMREFLIKGCENGEDLWEIYRQNIVELRRKIICENEKIVKEIFSNM